MFLETLTELINSLLHEPQAGLLNGILFGTKATLDPDLKIALTTSGTLHIIALSGMNISILVTLVHLVLLRFVRRPIANVATSLIIIGFIWLVGASPSVIRAAIMGGISLLAVSLGRQQWPLLSWTLAVVIMLLLNPLWIGDLSFQLSVMATLGIILFGSKTPIAGRRIILSTVTQDMVSTSDKTMLLDGCATNRAPTKAISAFLWGLIGDDLRVTLAAQVFTVPIIFFQFHRISLVSPLSNILIGPLIAPIMVLGFAVVAGGLLWMPLGTVFAWIAWVPLTYVIGVIQWTAKLPFASISF